MLYRLFDNVAPKAAKAAAQAGITVRPSVTKQTTLLVVGDQDLVLLNGNTKSSKHKRAEDLRAAGQDIRILGESDFLKMLE